MTEKTEALIAEAREWSSDYASWGDNGLVDRLADALEAAEARLAALATPQEGDAREALTRVRAKLERVPDSDAVMLDKADVHALLAALSRAAAPEPRLDIDPFLTPAEVAALPEGSVVMTETDAEIFGVYEQRVWQRFAGSRDWQFATPRHDWQCTDGGFVRMGDSERYSAPVFAMNRRVRLLFTPGPLPVGGDDAAS